MLTIRNGHVGDVERLFSCVRDEQVAQVTQSREAVETGSETIDPEVTRYAEDDGAPVAAWGIFRKGEIPMAWALVTPRAKRFALSVSRAVRRHLEEVVHRDLGIDQVLAVVDTQDAVALRWARIMGFEDTLTLATDSIGRSYHLMLREWS